MDSFKVEIDILGVHIKGSEIILCVDDTDSIGRAFNGFQIGRRNGEQ